MSRIEVLRMKHHKILSEIMTVAGILSNPSMESRERIKLRQQFKEQLSKAIELEAQLLDLVSLQFLHKN
jgi:hypothetical protein